MYRDNWLAEARQFVEKHRAMLSTVPVWPFSSGPLGLDEPTPPGDFTHLPELIRATQARGHRTFVGKLHKGDLGLSGRLAATLNQPLAAISLARLYRFLYFLTTAYQEGKDTVVVAYMAAEAPALGVLKPARSRPLLPPASSTSP